MQKYDFVVFKNVMVKTDEFLVVILEAYRFVIVVLCVLLFQKCGNWSS